MEAIKPIYDIESAISLADEGEKIIPFWKPIGKGIGPQVFCQWYKSYFTDGKITFNCTEQYMMYQKAMLFSDTEIAKEILKETVPAKMKEYGRKIKGFDDVLWNKYKYAIVYEGNLLKFSQNPALKEYLLSTNDSIIVEASPYDKIWGVGLDEINDYINFPEDWKGQNLLGFAIMHVRKNLK